MNNYGITPDNLLRSLPDVLRNDENMLALATAVSNALADRTAEIDKIKIYTQIDKLPEALLDILAHDFKVDWYGYNYNIDAKRALIKDSFNIHRHLGTRGAVVKALNDTHPGSEVEEWFNYGGQPYFFRVILDVTDQRVPIIDDDVVRIIDLYKSLRSHLQDNSIIYRSSNDIVIEVSSGYVIYGTRLCGTYPVIATQGEMETSSLDVGTDSGAVAYTSRFCGTALGTLF